jgi:hypothetical protein
VIRECKHPTCGATCRREKKPKNNRFTRAPVGVPLRAISLPILLNTAQLLCNALVRLRDQNKGCISCQKGKVKHAGHFFPQGKFSGVRFDLINVNGQCDFCNNGMTGNLEEYHSGMIAKYGAEVVKELEELANATKLYKWRRSELEELIEYLKVEIKKCK